MEHIVFLDRNAIRAPLRSPKFSHQWQEYATTQPNRRVERLQNATIAITNRVSLAESELAQLPLLRFIAVAATGVDCIDLDACRDRGIVVSNIRNWSVSVAEHVFALLLALRRNLLTYHNEVQSGAWRESPTYTLLLEPMPLALRGSTMGIIGYGSIGSTVAGIAESFGMKVIIAEHKDCRVIREGRYPFFEVLQESDVLVILCPLTEQTSGLIGDDELKEMRRHALLINCARGGIVDDEALSKALKNGGIAGAGVDVLSKEPPLEGNPLLDLHQPNLIVTPHVAWASVQSLETLTEQLIGNLEAFAAGVPENVVT